MLELDFEPRIPRLSDRRLYAFEPARHYGRLAPLFGRRLDRDRIAPHWPEIAEVIGAIQNRTVTPSLILGRLSAQRQQGGLAAALREIGRIERTLFILRWFEDADLRRTVTATWRTSRPVPQPSTSSPPPSSCSIAAISAAWSRTQPVPDVETARAGQLPLAGHP